MDSCAEEKSLYSGRSATHTQVSHTKESQHLR